jgi:rubrerythrin
VIIYLRGVFIKNNKGGIKMTEIEALKLAIIKEEAAVKMYQEMLISHPALRDLLSFLVTEEQKHKLLIEKKIAELSCC